MSSDHPWMKFYPRDWRGDQALRAVSMAARGFWIECICVMHEAKPYGHLVLNGVPLEAAALARMTGSSVNEVSALLAELRQAGVLSVTSKGVSFSRRMTRDHVRAQKGKKAVSRRWAKPIGKPEENRAPHRYTNWEPITQKPDTREDIGSSEEQRSSSEPCTKPPKKRHSYPPAFEELWKAYPGEVVESKSTAFKAWKKLSDEDRDKALMAIPALKAYVRSKEGYQPPHLATYLNQERFNGLLERRGRASNVITLADDIPEVIEPVDDDFWNTAAFGSKRVN
jgi:hypothetical protein